VHKVYFAPATPCDRLVAHSGVEPAIKETLMAQFKSLDPVQLLRPALPTASAFAHMPTAFDELKKKAENDNHRPGNIPS
jgi:hypothetical protein